MKPELQRIAIAEACGWKFDQYEVHPAITYEWAFDEKGKRRLIPDYLSDLDAMYEAEDSAFYKDVLWHRRYARAIHKIVIRDWNAQGDGPVPTEPSEAGWFAWYLGTHASATQKAEAFLRTLNLWEE